MSRLILVACLAASAFLPAIVTPVRAMDADEIALLTERLPASLRQEIFGMSYLLSDEELRDLLAYKSEDRCERWLSDWWRDRDPIYTTAENESRTEFRARVEEARERFPIMAWPGWDQRGEVIIRYGMPVWRTVVPPGVDDNGIERAVEMWYFRAQDMFVLFEDAFGNGRYSYMIGHVGLLRGAGARNERRSLPSKELLDSNMDEKTIDAAFNVVLNDGSTLMPDLAAAAEYGTFREKLLRFPDVLVSDPAMFRGDLEQTRLPVDYSVECFRGGDGVDRVDVNAAFTAAVSGAETKYVATAIFSNSDGREVQRNVNTTSAPATTGGAAPPVIMSQLRFTLPPDFYHVAVTVEEFGTGRYASFRADKTCPSFDGRLAVSDLMFASRIGPAQAESVFNRGSLYVLPHPVRRYREGAPVPLYFEVYNLAPGRDGQASYTVSYRLTANEPRPAGFLGLSSDTTPLDVESRFTSTSPGPDDVVDITLRSGNLWKGSYTLEVTITDDVSDRQVSRSVTFEIAD